LAFDLRIVVAGFLAGLTASIAGFGIGILIPVVGIQTGAKTAIALVSLPDFLGASVRFWLLRSIIDKNPNPVRLTSRCRRIKWDLLHFFFVSNALQILFSVMLIVTGILGVIQISECIRFDRIIGAIAGFFGGLVGEQGGIRSVALLNFDLEEEALITTATAIALSVDAVRMPVYFLTQSLQISQFLV
jgi:uncharacterized protein